MKSKVRKPKVGEVVGTFGRQGTFRVMAVHDHNHTVTLQLANGNGPSESGIPWTMLLRRNNEDASQAAVRIVREATEDHE
jgi:hypothetical protein